MYAHLAEIPKLDATYQKGWLQYAGIPQPRYSALKANNGDTLRLGYFSQGMVLTERIKEAVPGKTLAFSVHLSESILRDTPIDKHVLESGYFDFETVRYTLRPKGNGTELSLRCTYTLATTVNSYGNAWANYLLGDFEERLLEALKAALAAS